VYIYEGANLIAEANGTGNLAARYITGSGIDEPLAVYHNATWEFYQADFVNWIVLSAVPLYGKRVGR
jgi:hypothetical protein